MDCRWLMSAAVRWAQWAAAGSSADSRQAASPLLNTWLLTAGSIPSAQHLAPHARRHPLCSTPGSSRQAASPLLNTWLLTAGGAACVARAAPHT